MIEINGKPYKISAKDKKDIEGLLNKNGQLVLEWHESRITVDPGKLRETGDIKKSQGKPPALPVSTTQTIRGENGSTDTVQYYQSKSYDPNLKRERFEPSMINFTDGKIVTDPELQLFFAKFCPMVSNSEAGINDAKNNSNYRPWLKIVVREQVAQEKLNQRKLRNTVEELILEKMSESDLRDISAMYKLSNPREEDINILREKLIQTLESKKVNLDVQRNYSEFMEKYKSIGDPDERDLIAKVVTEATSARILRFINTSNSWAIVDKNGKVEEGLCRVGNSRSGSKESVLHRHLSQNPNDLKKLQAALNEPKASKSKSTSKGN